MNRALAEDLGRAGDITTIATVPEATAARAALMARKAGTIAGLPVVAATFKRLAPEIEITPHARDGMAVSAKTELMTIAGPARAILAAERTALNFVGMLSGTATATARYVRKSRAHQDARDLHPQDDAGPARAAEIRDPLRRRLQSPLRPR